MNIKEVAAHTKLSAKQIRDYEKAGLISNVKRSSAGYRNYEQADVERLHFIAHARAVGFSLSQIATLLDLQDNPHRKSCEVKELTAYHINELSVKIQELQAMKDRLQAWHQLCVGDDEICPILKHLR